MKLSKLNIVLALAAFSGAMSANASLYDINFNGDGTVATGQIDVVNGVADSGFLNITGGAAQGTYTLYVWTGGGLSSVRVGGGTDLIVDNLVDVNNAPYLDTFGLAFVNQPEGINLSLNGGSGNDNIAGFGPVGYGVPNADGVLTLTAAPVPEPTTMVASALLLLPLGISTLRILRKKNDA